jgi:hypothetical protein
MPVLQAWDRNPTQEDTCVVCDSRTYCPDYQARYAAKHNEQTPRLPFARPDHEPWRCENHSPADTPSRWLDVTEKKKRAAERGRAA